MTEQRKSKRSTKKKKEIPEQERPVETVAVVDPSPPPGPPAEPPAHTSPASPGPAPMPEPGPAPRTVETMVPDKDRIEESLEDLGLMKRKEGHRERPRRDKFFSEAHPRIYGILTTILPRLHIYVPLFLLLYFAGWVEIIQHANYDFALDWYRGTWWLQSMFHLLTDQDLLVDWFERYYVIIIAVVVLIIAAIFAFYEMVWKSLFPDYVKHVHMKEYPEGRAYWYDGNAFMRWWDRVYRSPERKELKLWLHTRWWINPLNPQLSMVLLKLSPEEKAVKRGMTKLVVHERPRRYLIDHDKMATTDEQYVSGPIPLEETQGELDRRQAKLLTQTQTVALANPHIRKEQLRKSSLVAPPNFIEEVKKAQEGAADGS